MDPSYNNTFDSFGSGGGQMAQPIMSTGSGDIVLSSNQPAKKKKTSIIVGIVLILVAIGVGVAALILFLNKGSAQKDFKEIVSFIETIPDGYKWPEDGEDYSEEKEYVYAILISTKGTNDVSSYYSELNNKFENFLTKYQNVASEDYALEYGNMLKILQNLIDYREVEDNMIAAYDRDGVDGANDYYENIIKCSHKDEYIENICSDEENYYYARLLEYTGEAGYDTSIHSEAVNILNKMQSARIYKRLSETIKKMNQEMLEKLNG